MNFGRKTLCVLLTFALVASCAFSFGTLVFAGADDGAGCGVLMHVTTSHSYYYQNTGGKAVEASDLDENRCLARTFIVENRGEIPVRVRIQVRNGWNLPTGATGPESSTTTVPAGQSATIKMNCDLSAWLALEDSKLSSLWFRIDVQGETTNVVSKDVDLAVHTTQKGDLLLYKFAQALGASAEVIAPLDPVTGIWLSVTNGHSYWYQNTKTGAITTDDLDENQRLVRTFTVENRSGDDIAIIFRVTDNAWVTVDKSSLQTTVYAGDTLTVSLSVDLSEWLATEGNKLSSLWFRMDVTQPDSWSTVSQDTLLGIYSDREDDGLLIRFADALAQAEKVTVKPQTDFTCVAPDDEAIDYMGRWIMEEDGMMHGSFECGLVLRFTGTRIRLSGNGSGTALIAVDGGEVTKVTLAAYTTLFHNLEDGEHTLELYSAAQRGFPVIPGFVLEKGARVLPPVEGKMIEFIGDSIMEGYVDPADAGDFGSNSYRNSYGFLTGRRLMREYGMRFNTIAYGGIRIVERGDSVSNDPMGMPERYFCNREWKSEDGTLEESREAAGRWDTARYAPDYIVMNLGTNDRGGDHTRIQTELCAFLDRLSETYPDALIFVMTPFIGGSVIDDVKAGVAQAQSDKIVLIDSVLWNIPAGSDKLHPAPAAHETATELLYQALTEYLETPVLSGASVTACASRTVEVPVLFDHNPGVARAEMRVSFDESVFTLIDVRDGGLLGNATFDLSDPFTLTWQSDPAQGDNESGTAATLVFAVAANAPAGQYAIALDPVVFTNAAGENVTVSTKNALVTVRRVRFGDLSGDGEVTDADRTLLSRYLADWDMSKYELDLDAADINGDGRISAIDRMILARYLAGWGEEYDRFFE